MPLRLPSRVQRGTKKHPSPAVLRASTRNASHIGADMNHLRPLMRKNRRSPSPPTASARVVVVRRSEPPWFSVIAIPIIAERFVAAGRQRGS